MKESGSHIQPDDRLSLKFQESKQEEMKNSEVNWPSLCGLIVVVLLQGT